MKRAQQETGQRVLFTGPDGIGDYRPRLDYFPRSIGIGALSPDATRDLEYLFRSAPQATPPLPKHRYTGEFDKYHSVADGVAHSQWHTSPQFRDKQLPCTNRGTLDRQSEDNNAVPAKQGTVIVHRESSNRQRYFSPNIVWIDCGNAEHDMRPGSLIIFTLVAL
ncbi:hypothetical protein E1301_Tti003991 [Triplophysa tibetana]|uniref:Uncharacterized protein n=1 Tax=Triplophysa tibetana TaxID=1572043 RepID=A0A5A9NHY2_9TELE|nr:hypothetical protein E1301_Tti003991 [Triplophysa tibetana]